MKKAIIYALALSIFVTLPAQARKMVPGGCTTKDTVTVSIRYNDNADSIAEARQKVDERMKQISTFSKENKITEEPQSSNFSVNAQNYNNNKTYGISGSMNYQLDSEERAFAFADALDKKGFQVNISANSYRQGNCTTPKTME